MKIGFATDFYYPWVGGPATLIHHLAHGLQERGHTACVLAPSPTGRAYHEMDDAVAITRVPTIRSPFGYQLRVASPPYRAAGEWLHLEQPDVVHVHHPFPLSASAVHAARKRGIPLVATNHTIPECSLWGLRRSGPAYPIATKLFSRWIVSLLNRCDAVAAPSATAARATMSLGYSGPITAISNGIDTVRFSPRPASEKLRAQLQLDSRPIVLYTGRLDAEKQMGVWLQAAAGVRSPAQFVVGGEGADRKRLEKLAANLGLSDRISFIGYLPAEDLPDLYRLAALYLITSPVELQSITALEAIASGLPVVGVDAGALGELVKNGENGMLVPREDPSSASRAIDEILEDDALRRRMNESSRNLALDHDLSQSVARYEAFLAQAARREPGEQEYERGGIVWT